MYLRIIGITSIIVFEKAAGMAVIHVIDYVIWSTNCLFDLYAVGRSLMVLFLIQTLTGCTFDLFFVKYFLNLFFSMCLYTSFLCIWLKTIVSYSVLRSCFPESTCVKVFIHLCYNHYIHVVTLVTKSSTFKIHEHKMKDIFRWIHWLKACVVFFSALY